MGEFVDVQVGTSTNLGIGRLAGWLKRRRSYTRRLAEWVPHFEIGDDEPETRESDNVALPIIEQLTLTARGAHPSRNHSDQYEILEDRYAIRSTVVTSQLPVAKWHAVIGDPFCTARPTPQLPGFLYVT